MNKLLGQHFLKNKQIVADILRAGEVSKKDTVLEVGPGKGVLTEELSKEAKKVIAVEKDKNLVEFLKEKFKNQKNIEIIYGDILTTPTSRLLSEYFPLVRGRNKKEVFPPYQEPATPELKRGEGVWGGRYKIIANIPYYITSHFLRLFLSNPKLRPSVMVLMLQKEVAERIIAKNSKESLLSLSVKAYGEPKIIKIVRRGNFSPPPKVDSAIIKIITSPPHPLSENILSVARLAFQQKRKMIRHSLGKNIPEKYANMRPEDLKLENWNSIYLSLSRK